MFASKGGSVCSETFVPFSLHSVIMMCQHSRSSYRGRHPAFLGRVGTAEVRLVLECWTLETWESLASYLGYWTSPSVGTKTCEQIHENKPKTNNLKTGY